MTQSEAIPVDAFAGPDAKHYGVSIMKAVERLFYLLLFSTMGGFLVIMAVLDELEGQLGPLALGLVFWGAGGVIALAPLIRDRGIRLSISNYGVRLRRSGETSTLRWAEVRRMQWSTVNGQPHQVTLERWDGSELQIPMEAVAKAREAETQIRAAFGVAK